MRGPSTPALWLLSVVIMAGPAAGADADEALGRRLKEEYPAAFEKLNRFYANMRMTARQSMSDGSREKTWEYGGNTESLKFVELSKREPGEGTDTSPLFAVVADRSLSLRLSKDSSTGRYSIISMGPAAPRDYQRMIDMVHQRAAASCVAYSLHGSSILDFLSEKGFKINSLRSRRESDGEVVRVDWTLARPDGTRGAGWFDLAANRCWVLKEYDYHYTYPTQNAKSGQEVYTGQLGVMEYAGDQDGVPLIRRVRMWSQGPGSKSPETVIEVSEIIPGPVPKEEFSLTAFGIDTTPAAPSVPLFYYLLGLSAISGLAVLALWLIGRRPSRPDEAS